MIKAAFAKAVINDLWPVPAGWAYRDDIEARTAYFEGGNRRFLLMSLDISILSRQRDQTLRNEIARRTGIPVEDVLVHCEHTHNAVPYTLVDLDKIADRIAESIKPKMLKAPEVEMGFVCADVGSSFTVNRRQYVSDDLGVCTFWNGYRKVGDKADAAHMVKSLRENLGREQPLGHYSLMRAETPDEGRFPPDEGLPPIWFDRPVDRLVHLLIFRTREGKVLGSILRLAAHVTLAGHQLVRDKLYTADFPHYTRLRLEQELGGLGMFVNGMAGDLVPLFDEYTWNEVERYGNALADAALAEYGKGCEFKPLERLEVRSKIVDLPVRADMPVTAEESRQKDKVLFDEIRRARAFGAPARELKRLLDIENHYQYGPRKLFGWCYCTPEEVKKGWFPVRVTGCAFNDVLLVGVPGESMCETTFFLRSETIGKKLLTLFDCNGNVGYMAEARDFRLGGYEVACGAIAEDGETYLKNGALELIREFGV